MSTKKKSTKKAKKKRATKKVPAKTGLWAKLNRFRQSAFWRVTKFIGLRVFLSLFVFTLGLTAYLDISIRQQFEGKKWALPAHVYTRPLELYVGQTIQRSVIQDELDELGYVKRDTVDRVGRYKFTNNELKIYQREFRFWDELRPQQLTRVKMSGDIITSITVDESDKKAVEKQIIRLEPRLFGSVSPLSHEDRSLLKLEDVPQALIDGLIANEDRAFYSHFGINPLGIARAMVRNIQAGRFVQGGSTLTQQLVKNYYLTSAQTLERKFVEMIMSILLEIHYTKDEILQAYFNEVYLSQAGNRAIHGFELASRYFYGRPLQELDLDQLAMLIAINNGPSKYNPIRNPNDSTARRNLVLKTMLGQGVITQVEHDEAVSEKLKLSTTAQRAAPLSYPAFMGFVRENLKDEYVQDDLHSEGLQIYTTLNPRVQQALEKAVKSELTAIEKRKSMDSNTLQVAAVVIRTDNGEVAAVIGDRNTGFSGYNRAIKAQRPIGSLLKPFVYLGALEKPEQYSLATELNDMPIVVQQKGSSDWVPENYDGVEHGQVMMIEALSKSYNLSAVQLGMEIGIDEVSDVIRRVGYEKNFQEYPSILLGALPMNVMDVGQMYLTLASGGFKTPVKGIRSVLTNENEPLSRYPLEIEQVVEPEFNSLITYALQDVVRNGTGRSVSNGFKYDYGFAGKTGTTNDYRDSWFAGFSGNYLTVVWVGNDDNKPTGLTGASGAARVWAKIMQDIPQQRLELGFHEDVINKKIYYSFDKEFQDCSLSRQLPILISSIPLENVPCANYIQYDSSFNDEFRHFEPIENVDPRYSLPDSTSSPQIKNKPKKKTFWQKIFGN